MLKKLSYLCLSVVISLSVAVDAKEIDNIGQKVLKQVIKYLILKHTYAEWLPNIMPCPLYPEGQNYIDWHINNSVVESIEIQQS